jgi:PAS domain S-box-containing protein
LTFAVVASVCEAILVLQGAVDWPYLISFPYLVPLFVMGYELGSDVVRSARLARELHASRDELRDSEQRMSLAANAAELGFWEWDPDTNKVWLTERARAMFGGANLAPMVELDEFLARIHPEDRSALRASMSTAIRDASEYETEYRVASTDGATRWVAARGKVHLNGNTRPALLRAVSIDITRRKQAEERFRMVVEASPHGMIMVGPQGNIALVNAQTEKIFGYRRSELIGQSIDILVPERDRVNDPARRARFFTESRPRAIGAGRELFGRRKDGGDVPLEIGLNPIETPEGVFTLASIVDVTERRNAERESARQRNELAHLSRVAMLGELSGSLAHELNQPLTAILSNAQAALRFLAQDASNTDEVRAILSDIIDADNRAGETIRRLRLLFRKGEVENELIDVNTVVQEVLKILHSDLINNMVLPHTELEPDLPPVLGDRVQMQQVLINVMVNGSDAMSAIPQADRRLVVSSRRRTETEIMITIADQGCGIPAERLESVFEPFVTTKGHGMGLGLAVCRTIVCAHGGRIWATNNSDRGASIHITLPAAAAVELAGAGADAKI